MKPRFYWDAKRSAWLVDSSSVRVWMLTLEVNELNAEFRLGMLHSKR